MFSTKNWWVIDCVFSKESQILITFRKLSKLLLNFLGLYLLVYWKLLFLWQSLELGCITKWFNKDNSLGKVNKFNEILDSFYSISFILLKFLKEFHRCEFLPSDNTRTCTSMTNGQTSNCRWTSLHSSLLGCHCQIPILQKQRVRCSPFTHWTGKHQPKTYMYSTHGNWT